MDPIELSITIERIEVRSGPGLHEIAQGLDRHVDTDFVAVLEAVGDGFGRYGDGHWNAVDDVWVNQLIGVLTAIALCTISILGVVMWLKQKPQGAIGAPATFAGASKPWMIVAMFVLALLLPLFGASVVVLLVVDRLISRDR